MELSIWVCNPSLRKLFQCLICVIYILYSVNNELRLSKCNLKSSFSISNFFIFIPISNEKIFLLISFII
ncbi:hypothetical protein U3516DRAFT_891852, partial [Neocallimastix sp. 'constans']